MAAFKFAKPKNDSERTTAFEEYVDYIDHLWPNVIYSIVPTRDDRFPRTFNLSVGTFHVIVLCILLVVMLLTTKGYVKPGTILCAFCAGLS